VDPLTDDGTRRRKGKRAYRQHARPTPN
jgi:hypothetical protein